MNTIIVIIASCCFAVGLAIGNWMGYWYGRWTVMREQIIKLEEKLKH